MNDPKLNRLWEGVRVAPNFPKQGVCFYDITPLLDGRLSELCDALIAALPVSVLNDTQAFVAIEARGFLLATLLAAKTNKGLILVRKAGKLPPPTHRQSYALEYGAAALEIAANAAPKRVLIVDDVLATGGTLSAAAKLCQQAGHTTLGALFLIDIAHLRKSTDLDTWSVFRI